MVKTLARSIREFKKPAILTPLLVTVEVIWCIIPFTIAGVGRDAGRLRRGPVIVRYGVQLLFDNTLSLFGVAAGNTCATARRALPATCGRTCSTAHRIIPLKTSSVLRLSW